MKCMENKLIQIAIDGPVGSGKSTVTRLVAERLGFLYVDTGAMYRAACLLGSSHGLDFRNEGSLVELLTHATIELKTPSPHERDGRLITVLLDGNDVSWEIRTEEISRLVPVVAAMPAVRKILVAMQQKISQKQSVVMEGRDITYRVLPDADLKIYLTADVEIRAHRRMAQLQSKGQDVSYETVLSDLTQRDQADMSRPTDPLQIVPGAWVFDTSNLSIETVVDRICERVGQL